MSRESLEQFCRLVLADPELQRPLRETPDRPSFVACMRALGAERGYRFTDAEVEEALRAMRRAWLDRGIAP